jgi:hypothetical protein
MLAAGIAVTLVANILAGVAFGVLGAIVAAWPALALVGSYELLMITIRRARTALETAAETVADVTEGVSIPALEEAAGTVAVVTADAVPTLPTSEFGQTVARRARRRAADHTRKAERKYASDLAEGTLPSLRAVMADLHLGQDKAREVRQHLATLATANGQVSNG